MAKKHKDNTPKPRVLVEFLQDKSGSMSGVWRDNVAGFRSFIEKMREERGVDYLFSLRLFDHTVSNPLRQVPIAQVDAGFLGRYTAGGGTALHDTLGQALQDVDKTSQEFDKVIFVIVTDGQDENSKVWTKEAVHTCVDAKLSAGKTTFQYLGSQPEAWTDAAGIGFGAGQTVQYAPRNTVAMYACVGEAMNNFSVDPTLTATRSMTETFASANSLKDAGLKFDPTA